MYLPYKHKTFAGLDKLYVVTTVYNPERYKSRYELYHRFKIGMERLGAKLFTVEVAFGDRPFEVTRRDDPMNLQLRTDAEIWLKENSLNLAVERLPDDWEYLMWADSDIEFQRHDILEEIVHKLQHYAVIQPWRTAIDLGPRGEALKTMDSFMSSFCLGRPPAYTNGSYGPHWHSGFSWCCTREAWNDLGGLIDFAILGSADHHVAQALIGRALDHAPGRISESYKRGLEIWQDRANKHIRQNVGFCDGSLVHHFHGSKKNRKYVERWEILFKHNFDIDRDIKRDWQGLYQLSDEGLRLRNDVRRYFQSRVEDDMSP